MSTIKVNKIENTATADGGIAIDASGHVQVDGQQLPTAGALSNRNLIINGAMNVAQRGTSSTSNSMELTFRFRVGKRWRCYTISQDLSSGDPYNEGFRHFYRIQNTTATTASSHHREIFVKQQIEGTGSAANWLASSSSSSTLFSFWVKIICDGSLLSFG